MKIVFNTKYSESSSGASYAKALSKSSFVTVNDWDNYQNYDIALFMTYKGDLKELEKAKRENPEIITGVIDPRGSSLIEPHLDEIDIFIVDSIEMSDFWIGLGKPVFLYSEYPDVECITKEHKPKDTIVVAYHGNKLHMEQVNSGVINAIERIGCDHNVELRLVYDHKQLGELEKSLPKGVKVKHIQWHEKVYEEDLSDADIGIVPNLIGKPENMWDYLSIKFKKNKDDYVMKFKMSSNPGRIIVFANLGIPVVTDFYPSALQLIEHGKNGFLACSEGGWYECLKLLINDHALRQDLSDKLQRKVFELYDFDIQNKKLERFLKGILQ